jgi:5'-deoxynucleotidase YfbR-like HD superfamily hydrolase
MSYRNPLHGLDSTGEREPAVPLAKLVEVADLALRFGEINRTALFHRDQTTREDDAEHTVMLGWLAPALAERLYAHSLSMDVDFVAAMALVHDMPEVIAGDTPTIRIDDASRAAKADRETSAARQLVDMFDRSLPWLSEMVRIYEMQQHVEARFVRAVDKIVPKLVHLIDGGAGLRDHHVTRAEFREMVRAQRAEPYMAEFPELLDLHRALCDRVLNTVAFHLEDRP